MDNLYDFKDIKRKKQNELKLEKLKENIAELKEMEKTLHSSIISLTKFEKYSSIRRRIDDLFVLYQDTKRTIATRNDMLKRLNNEQ